MLLKLFLVRMGLSNEEAETIDELTSISQSVRSWIQWQADLRAKGVPGKLTKGEAAIGLMQITLDASFVDDKGRLLLIKGIAAIFGYQYQQNIIDRIEDIFRNEKYLNIVKPIIKANEEMINGQFQVSLDLYNNRGWLEKMLG
tara:strand:+ start:91 stop:519 length:429 start_codon:yes stop_codon:yes gene_type:complete